MNLELVELIRDANLERSQKTLLRRLVKIDEELGELAEAALSATNPHSPKGLTFADVREEAVDTLIISIDVLYTLAPEASLFETAADHADTIAALPINDTVMDENDLLSRIRTASREFGRVQTGYGPASVPHLMLGIKSIHRIAFGTYGASGDVVAKVDALVRSKVQKWLDTKHLAPLDS